MSGEVCRRALNNLCVQWSLGPVYLDPCTSAVGARESWAERAAGRLTLHAG